MFVKIKIKIMYINLKIYKEFYQSKYGPSFQTLILFNSHNILI